jgi:hypothetical protein
VEVVEDAGFSAKDLKRLGIQEALRVLEEGDAKALVAAKLDASRRPAPPGTAYGGFAAPYSRRRLRASVSLQRIWPSMSVSH